MSGEVNGARKDVRLIGGRKRMRPIKKTRQAFAPSLPFRHTPSEGCMFFPLQVQKLSTLHPTNLQNVQVGPINPYQLVTECCFCFIGFFFAKVIRLYWNNRNTNLICVLKSDRAWLSNICVSCE